MATTNATSERKQESTQASTRVLVVAPAWVGDMVMCQPLLQLIKAKQPNSFFQVVAPKATAPVATRMAEVDEVTVAEFEHGKLGWSARRGLGHQLRGHKFDVAYVLPNSWKSALLPWFANVKRRVGWLGESRYGLLNDARRLDKQAYPLMIERFMALADIDGQLPTKPYPLPQLTFDLQNRTQLLEQLNLQPKQVAVLCPGAEFGAAKKWPVAHYSQLAEDLLQAGYQVWLMGSPKDAEDAQAIQQVVPQAINLAGKTSLVDAIDLMSCAELVVSNDSGLMHVGCALNIATVGVFGSTSPGFTPPLGPRAEVVELEMDCRPCFKRECPLQHLNCLNQLQPAQVMRSVEKLKRVQ